MLMARRPSLVVCAFTSLEESARIRRGSGGFSIRGGKGWVDEGASDVANWWRMARVEVMRSFKAFWSLLLEDAIAIIWYWSVQRNVRVEEVTCM